MVKAEVDDDVVDFEDVVDIDDEDGDVLVVDDLLFEEGEVPIVPPENIFSNVVFPESSGALQTL